MRLYAARNLALDRLTAEIADRFGAESIDSLVLKGPALAEWLYPGEVRPYGDSDVMVRPGDWRRAITILEGLGFENFLEPMAHPRMESFASTAFLRGDDNLDLHCTLHGLAASPESVTAALFEGAVQQTIAGAALRVPGRSALLLHVGLHAAHHARGKPIEDLQRAISDADDELWSQALALARALDGVPAFASGLKLLPEGVALARQLGIDRVRSVRHEMRREGVPMAEGIDALLAPGLGMRERLQTLRREFFPPPAFMRWWTPLAGRGRLGLAAAYLWRAVWLIGNAPRAVIARRRAHRSR